MKILFLSPWFPFPPDNGIRTRLYHLLKALAQRHEIVLLSFVRDGDAPNSPQIRGWCSAVETVPWRSREGRALPSLLSPQPRSIVDAYSPPMKRLVDKWSRTIRFDLVVASTVDVARYAPAARARVLEEHNCTTRMMEEQYRKETRPLRRARYWMTWQKWRRYESRLLSGFDCATVVSEIDAAAVRAMSPNLPVHVIPNCADLDFYSGCAFAPEPDTLVFNGSLTFAANLDGVRYFLQDIFPAIKRRAPHVTLKITGRTDDVALASITRPASVHLTGHLPDIRPAVAASWVCVVPIRLGGGTRLKILEAMALGTPVVSTTKGAEGLNVQHGEHIMLADEPPEFARATVALLNDPALRARLARNARRLVEAQYDWRVSGAQFEALLRAQVERKDA